MKRFTLPSLFVIAAILLSSCSTHLGLSKLLGGSNKPAATKHIKATHTPPSPPTATPVGGQPASTPAAVNAVSVTSVGFMPNVIEVKVGTTVTWTNTDTSAQAFISDDGVLDSGSIAPGAAFTYTFNQAGTFIYHSTSAPTLIGTVIVMP